MRRPTLLAACLCLAGASPASAGMTVNAGWQEERERDSGLPASGLGAGVSFDLGPYAFLGVGYSSLRTESFEDATDGTHGRLEYRSGGPQLGVAWPWTERLGLTLAGGYAIARTIGIDGFGQDRPETQDGPTGSLMLWYQPASRVALSVARGYSYVGAAPGWDNSLGVGLNVWRKLWLDGAYYRSDGVEGWTVGLRSLVIAD